MFCFPEKCVCLPGLLTHLILRSAFFSSTTFLPSTDSSHLFHVYSYDALMSSEMKESVDF